MSLKEPRVGTIWAQLRSRANLLLVPAAPRFFRGLDLLGEHADVQRAGWLVLVHVLTVGLVTLNEISSEPSEAVRSTETDQHRFGYHLAPKLPRVTSAHVISSMYGDETTRLRYGSSTIRRPASQHNPPPRQ